MPRPAPTRVFVTRALTVLAVRYPLCGIVLCGAYLGGLTSAYAQSNIHPLQPTSGVQVSQPTAAPPVSTPATASGTPAAPTAQRAQISYSGNQLTVAASNSSLNQILREISRLTGTKITGGVTDERVFGTYGPAAPAKILAALLDGTGSNVLIVQSPDDQPTAAPVELVLTPRQGGPTPPNPNAPGFNDSADPQDDSSSPIQVSPRRSDPMPAQSQPPSASTPQQGAPPSSTDTPGTTPDQSPNGVKTPQQIYEQLLKLRQQSQQPQPQ